MKSFTEWLAMREMWFSPENSVQKNKRQKKNKNLEGTELPKSQQPRPAASQGAANPYPTGMNKA